ncbi:unnamed protein product, partial [Ectocarpus sp. 12 AP-2014]
LRQTTNDAAPYVPNGRAASYISSPLANNRCLSATDKEVVMMLSRDHDRHRVENSLATLAVSSKPHRISAPLPQVLLVACAESRLSDSLKVKGKRARAVGGVVTADPHQRIRFFVEHI